MAQLACESKQLAEPGAAYLGAGRPHSTPGHLDVKATFGVLLPSQAWVIGGLSAPLPVTDGLPNGLQDTVEERTETQASSSCQKEAPQVSQGPWCPRTSWLRIPGVPVIHTPFWS